MCSKKHQKAIIIALFAGIAAFFICDVTNLPTRFNIPINNINTTAWSIMVSVVIFILGYVLVDRSEAKKQTNARDNAVIVLQSIFQRYIKALCALCQPETGKELVEQLDNSFYLDDDVYDNYMATYTADNDSINAFAQNGDIDKKTFNTYKQIRKDFEEIAGIVLSQPYINTAPNLDYYGLACRIKEEAQRLGIYDAANEEVIERIKQQAENNSNFEPMEKRQSRIEKELEKYTANGEQQYFDTEYPSDQQKE